MTEATLETRVARLEAQVAELMRERGNGEKQRRDKTVVTEDEVTRELPAEGEKPTEEDRPPLGMEPGRDDWMETVGMFRGDPIMAEILEEAARIREEDRRLTREQFEKEDQMGQQEAG